MNGYKYLDRKVDFLLRNKYSLILINIFQSLKLQHVGNVKNCLSLGVLGSSVHR